MDEEQFQPLLEEITRLLGHTAEGRPGAQEANYIFLSELKGNTAMFVAVTLLDTLQEAISTARQVESGKYYRRQTPGKQQHKKLEDELSNIAKRIQEITLNYVATRPTTDSGDQQSATRPRRNDKYFQCGKDDDYEIEEYNEVYNTNITRKIGRPLKRRIEHLDDGEQRARKKPDRISPTEEAIEVPISHHSTESLLEPESDQESAETDLFDEFKYEEEKEEIKSLAIYLTNVEEVPMLEGEKESELTTKERIESLIEKNTELGEEDKGD
ncbi:14590_t:CDS:2, partial [Acaulospora morrowiae]